MACTLTLFSACVEFARSSSTNFMSIVQDAVYKSRYILVEDN